jgi:hypothetical protein
MTGNSKFSRGGKSKALNHTYGKYPQTRNNSSSGSNPSSDRADSVEKKRKDYQRSNEEAAAIISADLAKYGGEQGLQVRWARLVLSLQLATGNAA